MEKRRLGSFKGGRNVDKERLWHRYKLLREDAGKLNDVVMSVLFLCRKMKIFPVFSFVSVPFSDTLFDTIHSFIIQQ